MAFQGNIPVGKVTDALNSINFDAKRAVRETQAEVTKLISDLGDPNNDFIVIDGQSINKKTETARLTLAINNKMDNLTNQSTTVISLISEMFKLEKSIGQ